MNPFHNVVEVEIQKMEEKIKTLQTQVKTLREIFSVSGGVRLHRATGKYPNKSLPRRVKRENADAAFRKMPVVFTTREYCHMIREVTGVVVTSGCAYNWLRNFQKEDLVTPGPRTGKFGIGTWHKTEKGVTLRWHDRAQPPTV
jgi:hypothetical protein